MNITYKNMVDEFVDEDQTPQQKGYYKIYNSNGQIKKMEKFYDGKLKGLVYYKDLDESDQQIFDGIFVPGKFLSIVKKETRSEGYILEKELYFNTDGVLSSKSNMLYDVNKDLIAMELITDLNTGIPDYNNTEKFFYDRNVNPDECLFNCSYDEEGRLKELYYNNHHNNSDGQDSFLLDDSPEDIQELRELTGMSQQLAEYYVNPNVIPNF